MWGVGSREGADSHPWEGLGAEQTRAVSRPGVKVAQGGGCAFQDCETRSCGEEAQVPSSPALLTVPGSDAGCSHCRRPFCQAWVRRGVREQGLLLSFSHEVVSDSSRSMAAAGA